MLAVSYPVEILCVSTRGETEREIEVRPSVISWRIARSSTRVGTSDLPVILEITDERLWEMERDQRRKMEIKD